MIIPLAHLISGPRGNRKLPGDLKVQENRSAAGGELTALPNSLAGEERFVASFQEPHPGCRPIDPPTVKLR